MKRLHKVPVQVENPHMNAPGGGPFGGSVPMEEVSEVVVGMAAWDSGEITVPVEEILHVSSSASAPKSRKDLVTRPRWPTWWGDWCGDICVGAARQDAFASPRSENVGNSVAVGWDHSKIVDHSAMANGRCGSIDVSGDAMRQHTIPHDTPPRTTLVG